MAHVTVPAENSYVRYSSQTGTGPFAFTFTVFEKDDLEVRIDGSALATSAWTVAWDTSDDGGYTGGEITLNSSLTASSTVDIVSVIQAVRGTDFSSGSISPTSLNTEFDKVFAMLRDAQRDIGRTLRVDLTNTTSDLGLLSANASKVFAVNSSGTGVEFATNSGTGGGGSGSGDVSKVGTPVNNQIGVWTGDGTIEGDSGLTWDGSTLAVTGSITDDGVAIPTISSTDTLSNKTLASPVLTTPQINDTSSNQQYIFAPSELTADRTVTLPLLTGNDTFVFQAHTQTLTNKTIAFGSNTVSGTFAEFNTAVTDATLVSTSSTATLTNKTFDLGGTGNVLTGSTSEFNTALQSDSFAFLGSSNTFTSANDFTGATVKVPASATPTIAAQGDFALDTSVTNYAPGALRYHDGTNDMHVVAVAASVLSGTPTNGHVLTYDASNDLFYLAAAPGAGGGVSGTGTNNAVAVWSGTGAIDYTAGFTFDGTSLTLPATMFMTEVAAAAADVAGDGQIWVKNSTPNELWFTTDAGDDIQITTGTTINALTASGTATLTNKTYDLGGAGNTLTGSKAEFNTALQSDTFVMGSDLGTNVATFLATPSSANLAAAVTGESGTGALLFGTSPTIATPTLTLQDANGAAPTTDGQIKFDRTGETLEVGDGTGTKIFSHDEGTATLQNKSIDSANNTITLDLSELGGFTGTTAEFNSALSDGSFATLAGTETLTNKTITTPTLTLKQSATPTPTAEGDIQWDTDNNRIVVGDGTGQQTFYPGANGNVSNSGTPVNNQLAVWTDATTVEGDANLTWDGSELAVTGNVAITGGHIQITDAYGIQSPDGDYYIRFQDDVGSNENYLQVTNADSGSSPTLQGTGSDTNVGLILQSKNAEAIYAHRSDATTNAVQPALVIQHETTGTAASGFGVGVTAQAENAAGTMHEIGTLEWAWTTATDTSEVSDLVGYIYEGGSKTEAFRVDTSANQFNLPTGWAFSVNGTPLSSGGISASGTPVNNQLAVWTDASTVEGDSNLTWDGSTLTVGGAFSIGTSNAATVGTIELGAASDTTLARASAGNVSVEGTLLKKVGTETIWVPASAMTARTTSGAASGSAESTTNKVMIETFDFDAASDEFVQFSVAFPKSWNGGTITAQFFWSNASGTGTAAWAIQGMALADSDVLDTAFGTAIVTTDTVTTAGDLMVSAASSAVTIAGTPGDDELVYFQVYRDVSADTLAVDARLHGVKILYTTNAANDD